MARLARPLRGLAGFGLRFAPALANPMRPIRSATVRCSGVLKNHAAETRREKGPPRWEAPDFPRQRPAHCPLALGNVGGPRTPGNHTAETGLAGWGARIRTWEWRNQNPPVSPLISRIILKNRRNSTRFQSIGWTRIPNAPAARRRPCGAS